MPFARPEPGLLRIDPTFRRLAEKDRRTVDRSLGQAIYEFVEIRPGHKRLKGFEPSSVCASRIEVCRPPNVCILLGASAETMEWRITGA